MPLTLSPMQGEDVPIFTEIASLAFANDAFTPILFPNGVHIEDKLQMTKNRLYNMSNDPTIRLFKVTDSEENMIIACAQWHIEPGEGSAAEAEVKTTNGKEWEKPQPPPNANWDAKSRFAATGQECQRDIMQGLPHYALATLVTHPAHRRRGAASMLVQWGVDGADREGLEAYIEATDAGKKLYERFGFHTVNEYVMDFKEIGVEGEERHFCMVRMPRAK